ncbi:MAG: GAF domain-containing protein [Chloroflexi bacterium]|nr:GAF domain-containing protein [Chloroflexota bacterium]
MSGECILVVDDSKEIVRHLAELTLPAFGYKTLSAHDGPSGLELIREVEADLIMLDYNLPGMTGIDVLQRMAQESINTPVVLMTGYGSELSAIEAFRLGAKDYLIKPFTIDEIVETIDRALVETRLLHDKQELAEQLRRTKAEMSRQAHEMDTLSSIGKAITSLLSVDKILQRVLEAATYLTNAEDSAVWLPDASGTQLQAYGKLHRDKDSLPPNELGIIGSQVGEVMQTGRPLRQSMFSGQGIKVKTGFFARAILYAPLTLRGTTIGVLGVSNHEAFRAFSERDEFLLSFLADYAAIALENARVFQASDQALALGMEELNTLIGITHTITSSLDLDEVIKMTIKQVHRSWNIEASSLWLLDEKKQVLTVLDNVGTPMEILSQVAVPVGRGFVGYVAETGKWIYTNDVASHPVHYQEVDELTGFDTRALLCVPLQFGGRIIGALQLLNKLDGGFDDRDVERALTIAAAVAIAVTNALLFNEAETRKQHLEATLEHTNNPILIMDMADNVVLLNQDARTLLGLTKGVVGRPVTEIVQLPELLTLLTQSTEEEGFSQNELTLPDGTVWLPLIAPIPDLGRILILQDITRQKALSKAKDNFITTVSHDMRSPLNTISGFASNLGDVGPLNEQQRLFVDHIQNATERMMDLVNGLLELAKVTAELEHDYSSCDMLAIAEDVINEFQGPALTKQVSLNLEVKEPVDFVEGDEKQLRRALSNLVDNALKYSSEGQQVDVILTPEPNSVLISVQDQGPGISDDDLPFIFDKFYRSKKNSHVVGSGFGLALVDSIARAYGGDAWAENRNDSGSIFCLRLPFTQTG